jgi:hypothetical protein
MLGSKVKSIYLRRDCQGSMSDSREESIYALIFNRKKIDCPAWEEEEKFLAKATRLSRRYW